MRWLTLYLRSRRAPLALAVAGTVTVLMWSLWAVSSKTRDVGEPMVILTVLLMVAALTATLGSPDDALERTAAIAWPPRRAAHLLVVLLIVVGLLAITLVTPARFTPASVVARDAAGLLGLTALGATVLSPSRAWFLPLGWTLTAVLFPRADGRVWEAAMWQVQAPGSRAALIVALVLGVGGLVAYAVAGPARRAPADPALDGGF